MSQPSWVWPTVRSTTGPPRRALRERRCTPRWRPPPTCGAREARLDEPPGGSSNQRPFCSSLSAMSSIEAPPLSTGGRLWRFTRLTCGFHGNRTGGTNARPGADSGSVKLVMGSLTRERSTLPARRSPARPADSIRTRAVVLDLDEASPKRVSSTSASSSTSPSPAARGILEHAAEERDRPAGLGQGDPADGGIGRETATPPLGEQDLTGSARHQPEEPGVGQPAQKCPITDPAVGECRGEGVRVGATARTGHGPSQGQRGIEPIGDRAVQRTRHM